jgi:hydroxymethylpyrimidine pyrophosphatase-like HAD family hydrolase
MMEAVDIGYAVANAIPSVKAAAKRITVSNNDSALAKIIADIEAEIDAK